VSEDGEGIWVRLTLRSDTVINGFAGGAESPNDFWTTFRTQLVRLTSVQVKRPDGDLRQHSSLYVNRDSIVLAEVDADQA
jgi:hypothetical protein